MTILRNLANAHRKDGNPKEAALLYARAAETYRKTEGPTDEKTLSALNRQLVCLDEAKDFEAAFELADKLLSLYGETDEEAISAINWYKAFWHEELHQYESAAEILERLLCHSRMADNSDDLGLNLVHYGEVLLKLDRIFEAESVLRECLALRRETIPEAWETANTESLLGECLTELEAFPDAITLLENAHKSLETKKLEIPTVVRNTRLAESAQRLVNLYLRLGNQENSAKWQIVLDGLKGEAKDDR